MADMESIKKGYYIHFNAKITPGVQKKIDMQVEELGRHLIISELNILPEEVSFPRRLRRLLPGGAVERSYKAALENMENPDFIYVRRTTADKSYVDFFRIIKKKWPNCKVLIEIFTYPYDKDEFMRLLTWPYYFKEIYQRKKLVQYVDRYITYSEDEVIFGIPTIRTGNGILVDRVKLPRAEERADDTVSLIAVAFMQKHHGYERVIKGLHDYYKKGNIRKVVCHLVGDGPEKQGYRKLVQKYGLEEKVFFYPTMVGENLDRAYEKGDIAISAIGVYKDGLERENSLKTREYMAKGFPMITGCKVDGINEEYPFVCQFSNDTSPVDIEKVLAFYDGLCRKYSKKEMQQTIRSYVKKIADMPVVMKPIIDFINSQEK